MATRNTDSPRNCIVRRSMERWLGEANEPHPGLGAPLAEREAWRARSYARDRAERNAQDCAEALGGFVDWFYTDRHQRAVVGRFVAC